MSTVPVKYQCDVEGCNGLVTFEQAESQSWYVVILSKDPRFVGIFPWSSTPSDLLQQAWKAHLWHACNWNHATLLQSDAAVSL
jgi:hypothetical protein